MEDHKTVTSKSCGGRKEVVFEIVVGKNPTTLMARPEINTTVHKT